ncbi:bifunctional helix-turn-helix domain-containing protein/methylated-DNA--[protein]-cysteine S-methyltransferase [Tenacibaculum ascidiaceicola]|uniref:bifunctional helix-turn-helix domain-containing protein/methylated-DNA--[protein]-cysteine S-methyltransferase n=1 Tax=Tenacibaculum TaxID=104267 RepID=UPI003CE466D0
MENIYHYDIIAKAIKFIKDHYEEQPDLEKIANHVNLSKFHFQRVFKKWAGISPKDYVQFVTLEKAKELLRKGQSTLETSYNVGLSGNSRLHDLFIKIEACTPGEFQKRGKNLKFYFGEIETPFGSAIIIETKKGICNLSFDNLSLEKIKSEYHQAIFTKELQSNGKLVQEYFKNWKIPTTPINLDLQGTPFQIQVWKALLQIPSSNLLSYKDIAEMISNPKAVRAVGSAIGKNPIAYLIPCHRVIKSDGNMGNYRWSADRKIIINSYESVKL